jgi:hypothetical protein
MLSSIMPFYTETDAKNQTLTLKTNVFMTRRKEHGNNNGNEQRRTRINQNVGF